jgi:hypothetical protein
MPAAKSSEVSTADSAYSGCPSSIVSTCARPISTTEKPTPIAPK